MYFTNANITEKYAVRSQTRTYNGLHLLNYALLNTTPYITKKQIDDNGKEIDVPDGQAIQRASVKIEKIREGFLTWLDSQDQDFKSSFPIVIITCLIVISNLNMMDRI